MPITRHGYSIHPNKDSAYRRRARTVTLSSATHCHICGKPATPDDPLEADHIVPVSYGGSDGWWNMRPAHRSCNRSRGSG